jgi:hypothetical protein
MPETGVERKKVGNGNAEPASASGPIHVESRPNDDGAASGSAWAAFGVEQEGIDEGLDQGKLVLAQMPDEGVAHLGGLAGVGREPVAGQALEL